MGLLLEVLAFILIPVWLISLVGRAIPPLDRFMHRFSGVMSIVCLALSGLLFTSFSSKAAFMFPAILAVAFLFYGRSKK
jgi:hypothetical protein